MYLGVVWLRINWINLFPFDTLWIQYICSKRQAFTKSCVNVHCMRQLCQVLDAINTQPSGYVFVSSIYWTVTVPMSSLIQICTLAMMCRSVNRDDGQQQWSGCITPMELQQWWPYVPAQNCIRTIRNKMEKEITGVYL